MPPGAQANLVKDHELVKKVQSILKLPETGEWDADTAKAVVEVQLQNDITASGTLDAPTVFALGV